MQNEILPWWPMVTKQAPVHIPTPLELFDWAVVRQSKLGPGVMTCATAFSITPQQVREVVREWNDIRGTLECVRTGPREWRIDAYYNTTG